MVYPGREQHLQYLLQGLKKTGVPLVEWDGTQFLPAAMGDDIGMYVLIPKLATWFNLELSNAISLFFIGLSSVTCALSIWGFCKLFQSWPARALASIGALVLTRLSLTSLDVYCIPGAIAIAIIPWALYYAQKHFSWSSVLFCLVTGLGTGLAHYIRGHSGTTLLLFVGVLVIGNQKFSRTHKFLSFLTIALGFFAVSGYFSYCIAHYHTFVQEHLPEYEWMQVHHPFWHTIYAGLGFISNNLGLQFDDTAPMKRVGAVAPHLHTPLIGPWNVPFLNKEYEIVLRNEVISLLKNHTFYVVRVMVAKVGLLLFYLLLFANLGLFFLSQLAFVTRCAFAIALLWGALPGLLAVPTFLYLTGYITVAGLLGIVGIATALESGVNIRSTISQKTGNFWQQLAPSEN